MATFNGTNMIFDSEVEQVTYELKKLIATSKEAQFTTYLKNTLEEVKKNPSSALTLREKIKKNYDIYAARMLMTYKVDIPFYHDAIYEGMKKPEIKSPYSNDIDINPYSNDIDDNPYINDVKTTPNLAPKVVNPAPSTSPKIESLTYASSPKVESTASTVAPKVESPTYASSPKVESTASTVAPKVESPTSTTINSPDTSKTNSVSTGTIVWKTAAFIGGFYAYNIFASYLGGFLSDFLYDSINYNTTFGKTIFLVVFGTALGNFYFWGITILSNLLIHKIPVIIGIAIAVIMNLLAISIIFDWVFLILWLIQLGSMTIPLVVRGLVIADDKKNSGK